MPIPKLYEKLPIDPAPVNNLLTQGIVYELAALAAKEGLFTALTVRKSAAGLARELAWDQSITERVLQVLVQAGYHNCVAGIYVTVEAMAKYLNRDSPWFLADSLLSEFPAGSFAHRVLQALNTKNSSPCRHIKAPNQTER